MRAWEDIVNKALLGSEKASLTTDDLAKEIADAYAVASSSDKEESFLKISALVFQFRQSGVRPMEAKHAMQTAAEPEAKPYCSTKANAILKTLLEEELHALLKFWLQLCAAKAQLAQPEVLPALLDLAGRKKELRNPIMPVAGERGKWLCTLNPQWNFSAADGDTNTVWNEGSTEERKNLLRHLRTIDPEEGRKLLETSWETEAANEKLAFLEILKTHVSANDLPWLGSLREKGQKVNAAILELLKLIPSSNVVQEYQKTLAACVSLKTGKALLGMINKTEIVVNESFTFPEAIFKTGIEKLSSDKKISDNSNVLAQLMMSVPPSFWAERLQRTPSAIIELFQKDKQTAFYLPAISIASARFSETDWTRIILDEADRDLISSAIVTLLSGLPDGDRDKYALKFFEEQPAQIIQLMLANETEWTLDLARMILKYTAREAYQYNKTFYRQAVALLPVSILDHLESFAPDEEQKKPYWQTQRDELARLLTLKQQTLQSFKV
jgi:hypothetical protein